MAQHESIRSLLQPLQELDLASWVKKSLELPRHRAASYGDAKLSPCAALFLDLRLGVKFLGHEPNIQLDAPIVFGTAEQVAKL